MVFRVTGLVDQLTLDRFDFRERRGAQGDDERGDGEPGEQLAHHMLPSKTA
jgi:hypothetical protein